MALKQVNNDRLVMVLCMLLVLGPTLAAGVYSYLKFRHEYPVKVVVQEEIETPTLRGRLSQLVERTVYVDPLEKQVGYNPCTGFTWITLSLRNGLVWERRHTAFVCQRGYYSSVKEDWASPQRSRVYYSVFPKALRTNDS